MLFALPVINEAVAHIDSVWEREIWRLSLRNQGYADDATLGHHPQGVVEVGEGIRPAERRKN